MKLLIDPFTVISVIQGRETATATNPNPSNYDPTLVNQTAGSPQSISLQGDFQQGGPQGFTVDGEAGLATVYTGIWLSTDAEIDEGISAAGLTAFTFTPNITVITANGVDYQIVKIRDRFFNGNHTAKEFLLGR